MHYITRVWREPAQPVLSCIIWWKDMDRGGYIKAGEDGRLIREQNTELVSAHCATAIPDDAYLFRLPLDDGELILQSLAEGLAKAGFVAEVDNAQRITAEARAKMLEADRQYFRQLLEKVLTKGEII